MVDNVTSAHFPVVYTPQEVLSIFREQLRTQGKVIVLNELVYLSRK